LSADDLVRRRMANLLLSTSQARTPAEVVQWMGAMQAQEINSGNGRWGRIGATESDVDGASGVARSCELADAWNDPPRPSQDALMLPPRAPGAQWLAGPVDYLELDEAIVTRCAATLMQPWCTQPVPAVRFCNS
jgi:hypothetical protein